MKIYMKKSPHSYSVQVTSSWFQARETQRSTFMTNPTLRYRHVSVWWWADIKAATSLVLLSLRCLGLSLAAPPMAWLQFEISNLPNLRLRFLDTIKKFLVLNLLSRTLCWLHVHIKEKSASEASDRSLFRNEVHVSWNLQTSQCSKEATNWLR